jgi:hypothetical protein
MKERRLGVLFAVGLVVTLGIAMGLAQLASSDPDGLEYVAEREGFADAAEGHDLEEAPLADYGEGLTERGWLDTAIAGFVGTMATLALGYGVVRFARRTQRGSGGDVGSSPTG